MIYLRRYGKEAIHFRKREKLMDVRFKIVRFFYLLFAIFSEVQYDLLSYRLALILDCFRYSVLLILVVAYFLRILWLMRKFHFFEYNVHKKNIVAYGVSVALVEALKVIFVYKNFENVQNGVGVLTDNARIHY